MIPASVFGERLAEDWIQKSRRKRVPSCDVGIEPSVCGEHPIWDSPAGWRPRESVRDSLCAASSKRADYRTAQSTTIEGCMLGDEDEMDEVLAPRPLPAITVDPRVGVPALLLRHSSNTRNTGPAHVGTTH